MHTAVPNSVCMLPPTIISFSKSEITNTSQPIPAAYRLLHIKPITPLPSHFPSQPPRASRTVRVRVDSHYDRLDTSATAPAHVLPTLKMKYLRAQGAVSSVFHAAVWTVPGGAGEDFYDLLAHSGEIDYFCWSRCVGMFGWTTRCSDQTTEPRRHLPKAERTWTQGLAGGNERIVVVRSPRIYEHLRQCRRVLHKQSLLDFHALSVENILTELLVCVCVGSPEALLRGDFDFSGPRYGRVMIDT